MPSPVGHALGGAIAALLVAPERRQSIARRFPGFGWLAWYAAAACLPDIDFLWARHNMETHSLGFSALVGLAAWAWTRAPRVGVACALAVATHVLFDWLGSDDAAPIGVMALWPLSSEFYFADAYLFNTIGRHYWRPGFVWNNAVALARELAILAPIAWLAYLIRRIALVPTAPRAAKTQSPES